MIKRNNYLFICFLIMFLLFILDSTLGFFLPFDYTKTGISIVPCISLMMFSLLVRTIEEPKNYFFAAVCGVYYSVIYSDSLAIYILIFCFVTFIGSSVLKLESFNLFETMAYCIGVVIFQELVVFWLVKITGVTYLSITNYLLTRLLPTVALNLVFSIPIYYLFNYILRRKSNH